MDRRLDPGSTAPVPVALSGGGDSLALLHLTMDWAKRHGRRVLALTVDHGLNPDSARWTAEAGEKARALGADWRGLAWEAPKPSTGLQAKARAARHALLAEAAREVGSQAVPFGHTANDVIEGEVMRADATRGLGHLREWGPSPVWPEGRGIFLVRPLLTVWRADLRMLLQGLDAAWLDDPANDNREFARARARQMLEEGEQIAVTMVGIAGIEPEISELARAVSFAPGLACAPRAAFTEARPDVAAWALSAALLCISGTTTPPRRDELDHAMEMLRDGQPFTLAGCQVKTNRTVLTVGRELGRRDQAAMPEEPSTWVAQRFYAACGLYRNEASIPRA
ncbi:MAG: tRNA lysidine(34) synthetase TilS [Pseudomonadota bacterium]|nr:tRNA lysidine(34) synthetase TilS [Pseudomonadota bacterium]